MQIFPFISNRLNCVDCSTECAFSGRRYKMDGVEVTFFNLSNVKCVCPHCMYDRVKAIFSIKNHTGSLVNNVCSISGIEGPVLETQNGYFGVSDRDAITIEVGFRVLVNNVPASFVSLESIRKLLKEDGYMTGEDSSESQKVTEIEQKENHNWFLTSSDDGHGI